VSVQKLLITIAGIYPYCERTEHASLCQKASLWEMMMTMMIKVMIMMIQISVHKYKHKYTTVNNDFMWTCRQTHTHTTPDDHL